MEIDRVPKNIPRIFEELARRLEQSSSFGDTMFRRAFPERREQTFYPGPKRTPRRLGAIQRDMHETYSADLVLTIDKVALARFLGRAEAFKAISSKNRPVLEKTADYIREVVIPRKFAEGDAGRWPALEEITKTNRKYLIETHGYAITEDHPILINSGDLFASLTEKEHPQHIEEIKTGVNARIIIGASSAKFITHQLGADIPIRGTLVHIPQRSMVPQEEDLKQQDINYIRDLWVDMYSIPWRS